MATGVAATVGASALADVRTSTRTQTYNVGGTTANTLVAYMRSNPFPGSQGDAVANIRPAYKLDIRSRQDGALCRANDVKLDISFTMTLPQARNQLDPATRSAWNDFTAFTRRHEETHRAIYVTCGKEFVAKAERLTASTCAALDTAIRKLLEVERAVCAGKHRAFDRADAQRFAKLGLFRMAKGASRASR